MIKYTATTETITRENVHGGSGIVRIAKKLDTDDEIQGLDLFAEVTIDVGASIGYHIHESDAEAYYILQGEGIFLDHGKIQKSVRKGDLCLITQMQGHGMINTGEQPLKMIAVVWS